MSVTPQAVRRELHRINFGGLVQISAPDPGMYRPDASLEHDVIGCCTDCEDRSIQPLQRDGQSPLTQVSHSVHSLDFLDLAQEAVDESWISEGVLFLFEAPGPWWSGYAKAPIQGKYPIETWYWLVGRRSRDDHALPHFSAGFGQRRYGDLVASAIRHFKLANAVVTNLVKCGVATTERGPAALRDYSEECLENCCDQILARELAVLNPRVVFLMGSSVRAAVNALGVLADEVVRVQLPHPASRLRTKYRIASNLLGIASGLYRAGLLDPETASNLVHEYLEEVPA